MSDAATRTVFSIPPSAFLNADGSIHTGAVTISAVTIDPSDEAALAGMPGDFCAKVFKNRGPGEGRHGGLSGDFGVQENSNANDFRNRIRSAE